MRSDVLLISCIMPTRGRQQWAREAVEMFQAQTYPEKELVIVDDIMEPSFVDPPHIENVIYTKAPRLTIGGKRNLAVSHSLGEIIAHWDSDDRYTSDRLEHQAAMLTTDLDMVGYNEMEFSDAETGRRWMYHASPCFPIGVSMMYWRSTWQARNFPDVNVGEDVEFCRDRRVRCVASDGRIIARVHSGNTSEKRGPAAQNPAQWRLIA